MIKQNYIKTLVTSIMIMTMSITTIEAVNPVTACVKDKENEKQYIVCTKNDLGLKMIEKNHEKSDDINNNAFGCLEENKMITIEMTEQEAERLINDRSVCFVEEDISVEANWHDISYFKKDKLIHKKNEKRIQENKSETEWNARMIRSDKVKLNKDSQLKNKVKIAILDSGVDYGNDIELASTVTLVPGEEEMNPLFMDGTGHGNSVAGLIAATQNNDGITGINPNAEIYSIRVLDDENSAPISRVIEGIYMAIDLKVNIINMSFGVNQYSAALEKAVKDAEEAGILVIAAAGNTGEKGVQYPAAFDEVMAVGSVDKYGNLADASAIGEEVEIVAPGELVRSTGQFGDELVSSGTSLSAPQVAAAASLIWEKDLGMPAEFVRTLLNVSANSYGDKNKYGYGLLDVEYALENYDEYKEQFVERKERLSLKENEKVVLSFDETNCVEGSWVGDDHEALVSSQNNILKAGARFPDKEKGYIKENGEHIFEGMVENPWWHGYHTTNYVTSYIYETRLANKERYGGTANVPGYMTGARARTIREDIAEIKWKKEIKNETITKEKKHAFIWGMAIHNLADSFSHSTYQGDEYLSHKSGKAHLKTEHGNRWACAKRAVNTAVSEYNESKKSNKSGTYDVFKAALSAENFKMRNIKKYVAEVAGEEIAKKFTSVNYTK